MLYVYIYICYYEKNASSQYHHNGFVATHALGHMMYGYNREDRQIDIYIDR